MTQPTHIQIAPPCPACFWALTTTPHQCNMCGWANPAGLYAELARETLAQARTRDGAQIKLGAKPALTSHPP